MQMSRQNRRYQEPPSYVYYIGCGYVVPRASLAIEEERNMMQKP